MIKILTVGNSFSNDASFFLPRMFQSGDADFRVDRTASLGGHSFGMHQSYVDIFERDPADLDGRRYWKGRKKHLSLPMILEMDDWDYITIQQVSAQSPFAETFADGEKLHATIRRYASKPEIVIHETWSYRRDSLWLKEQGFSEREMYERLHQNYAALAGKLGGLRIIPTGSAFQAALTSPEWGMKLSRKDPAKLRPGETPDDYHSLHVGYCWRTDSETNLPVLAFDPNHASKYGRFLGGAVWYEFFRGGVEANGYCPRGITRAEAGFLRRIAAETVKNSKKG